MQPLERVFKFGWKTGKRRFARQVRYFSIGRRAIMTGMAARARIRVTGPGTAFAADSKELRSRRSPRQRRPARRT